MILLTKEAVDYVFKNIEYFKNNKEAKLICELRLNGLSYREIGKEVNLTINKVREYILKVQRLYNHYKDNR